MLNMTTNHSLMKVLTYVMLALVLGSIFIAYFAPETMIAITNQVWAMCGW